MAKKQKAPPMDGLGPRERKKIDSAIRQVWYRSKARSTAVKRCTDQQGFTRCEKCKKRTPKIKVDHIVPCGPVDSDGYITRLFCPSSQLQCLCHPCHKPKTKAEALIRKFEKSANEAFSLARLCGQPIGVNIDPPKKKKLFTDKY